MIAKDNPTDMRVLHLLRTLDPLNGGPVTYWRAVQAAMAGSPVTVEAATPGCGEAGVAFAASQEDGTGLVDVLRFYAWLRAHMANYDVVHIHGIFSWPLALGALEARRAGVPYVVSSHGHLYPWSLTQKRRRKAIYLKASAREQLRAASAVVVTCALEDAEIQRFDSKLRRAIVLPGLESSDLMPGDGPVASGHDSELQLLFLNRIAPQKGFPVLLRAAARLLEQGIRFKLTVAGEGEPEYCRAMKTLQHELGLDEVVSWRGFVHGADKQELLRQADVFVLSSNMENFSFATAEALAAGLPAVVTEAVALSEEVARHHCGTVCPPGDDCAFALAIARYVDPELRKLHASNARRCAQASFSLTAMRESLEELYRSATVIAR